MDEHGLQNQKRKQTDPFLDATTGEVTVTSKTQRAMGARMLDNSANDTQPQAFPLKCLPLFVSSCSCCQQYH